MEFLPNQSPTWQTVIDNNSQDGLSAHSLNPSFPTADNVLQDIQTALKSATQTYEHVEVLLCCLDASDASALHMENQHSLNMHHMLELGESLKLFDWHVTSITFRPRDSLLRRVNQHIGGIVGKLGKNDIFIVYHIDSGATFQNYYDADENYIRTKSGHIFNFARMLRNASRKSAADVLGLWEFPSEDTHGRGTIYETGLSRVFLIPSITNYTEDTPHRFLGRYNFTRLQHVLLRLSKALSQVDARGRVHGFEYLDFKSLHEQYAQRIEVQLTPVSDPKERGFIALDYTKFRSTAAPRSSRIEVTILAQPNAWDAALDWFANHAGDDEVRLRRQYHTDAVTFGKSGIEQPFRVFMPVQLFTHFPRSQCYLGWGFVYGEDSDGDVSEKDDLNGPPPDEADPEDGRIFEKDSWEVSQGWPGIGHMLSEVFDDEEWLTTGVVDQRTRTPTPPAAGNHIWGLNDHQWNELLDVWNRYC